MAQQLHTISRSKANYNPISFRRPMQDNRWDEGKIWQLLIPSENPLATDTTLLGVDAVKRLVADGILPHRSCASCQRPMALHQNTGYVDSCYWKCTHRNPKNKRPCKGPTSSVRTGALYERSTLSIPELSYSQMKEKMKIANHETIGRWTKFLREVVFHLVFGLSAQFTQIGGVGQIVEIDESLFGKKRKYHRGSHRKGEWVFGGVERGTDRCFLVIVPNRKRNTLLSIIKQYIAPGTTIISGEWRAYKCLGKHGYNHLTVNHSKHFKDPITGAHTNTVEGMWAHAKRMLIKGGTPRKHLFTCLALFMMKRMLAAQQEHDIFVAFMKLANSCVADGNVIPGNYGNWIPQPEQDSIILNTIEEDPDDSDVNDEGVEDATGANITDLESDNEDNTQQLSDPPSSVSSPNNPPSPVTNPLLPRANDPPVEPPRSKRQRRLPYHLKDYQL